MKRILVTDTHLGRKNGADEFHNITLKLFEEICEYADCNGIKELIHLADFFDSRRAISVKTIPVAYEIIKLLNKTFDETYLLVGNHDIYYKNRMNPTSLQMFQNIEGINIVSEPMTLGNNITLQPWLLDDYKHQFVPHEGTYLLGHFEMSGIVINRVGTESKGGTPISTFKGYEKVFSGHYHTKSTTGNITYLGSPYHMTFNDDGSRGFYEFDDETGDLEFIEFNGAPKFYIFAHDKIDEELVKNNNVKIVFTEDIGTAKINKLTNKITELEPNQMFIEFNFDDTGSDEGNSLDVDEVIDLRSLENKYLDTVDFPEYIERKIIEKEMDNLWNILKEK